MMKEIPKYRSNQYIKLLNEKYVICEGVNIYQNEMLKYVIEHFERPDQIEIALVQNHGIDLKMDESSHIYIFHETN